MFGSPVEADAGGGFGGNPDDCCDQYCRFTVCVDGFDCTHEFHYVECDPPPGGGGGSGGGGGGSGGGGGAGGSGSGGGAATDPRDTTDEMRQQSAMCENDNVLIVDHCDPYQPTIECCFANSRYGHLCTTCDCAGCCFVYWPYTNVFNRTYYSACELDCKNGFQGGDANGTDDSSECSTILNNPHPASTF